MANKEESVADMADQTNKIQGSNQDDADDAAWDALMSDPAVVEETEKIAAEIRDAASKGGLGAVSEEGSTE